MDISAASRIFGHHHSTIARWLTRAGEHGGRLHHHFFLDFVALHVQVDELVTKVKEHSQQVYVWTTIAVKTKVLLAMHVGGRKQDDAHRFVHRVKQWLAVDCVPIFTSDWLKHYFYALTAHFGQWVALPGRKSPVWQVSTSLL